ncbi:sensor histidine kinase [Geodermatophilus maliterrae]|uniref:histidine kinase n=1 Tax=Geodermatophilus maliterrae TaxID=3162531 RepID=A0ABV3XGS6_9ACTN
MSAAGTADAPPWVHRVRRPAWVGDAGLAVALVTVGLATAPAIDRVSGTDRDVDLLALALVVGAGVATGWRRRRPAASLAGSVVCTGTYLALGYPFGPVLVMLAVGVYSVARRLPLGQATGWAGAALVALVGHVFSHPSGLPALAALVPAASWVAVPYTAGVARRLVLEARAQQLAERERRLVDAERLTIASEVHDIVGHGLAAIQMQADIALHLSEKRPEQAHEALAAISRASAEALGELRATLGALTPRGRQETVRPAPGLDRLAELRDRVEAAGVPVDLTVTGVARRLPASVDVVAYRVLQESLTNVVKHGAGARAAVRVHYGADSVRLETRNDDLLPHASGEGFGIAGMRRRVQQVGGTFSVGPEGDPRVFVVRATLPAPGGGR